MSPRTTRAAGLAASLRVSASARRKSTSTATTGRPLDARSVVSAPRPGPISTTGSFGSSTSAAMRAATRGSQRKLWPRRRLGRTPRDRSAAGTPLVADVGAALRSAGLEPEERTGRGIGSLLERLGGHAERGRHLIAHEDEVRRLVALASVRHGGEVRGVRLQEDLPHPELPEQGRDGALLEGGGSP